MKIEAKELHGANIFLDMVSVGATINIMLAAVHAKGQTTIENAANSAPCNSSTPLIFRVLVPAPLIFAPKLFKKFATSF
jgi:hypothetical protein